MTKHDLFILLKIWELAVAGKPISSTTPLEQWRFTSNIYTDELFDFYSNLRGLDNEQLIPNEKLTSFTFLISKYFSTLKDTTKKSDLITEQLFFSLAIALVKMHSKKFADLIPILINTDTFFSTELEDVAIANLFYYLGYIFDAEEISLSSRENSLFINPYTKLPFSTLHMQALSRHPEMAKTVACYVLTLQDQENSFKRKKITAAIVNTLRMAAKKLVNARGSNLDTVLMSELLENIETYDPNIKKILDSYIIIIENADHQLQIVRMHDVLEDLRKLLSGESSTCYHVIGKLLNSLCDDLSTLKYTKSALAFLKPQNDPMSPFVDALIAMCARNEKAQACIKSTFVIPPPAKAKTPPSSPTKKTALPSAAVLAHSMREVLSSEPLNDPLLSQVAETVPDSWESLVL